MFVFELNKLKAYIDRHIDICSGINGVNGTDGLDGQNAEEVKISSVKVTASCGYVNGVGTEGIWVRFWVDRDEDGWIGSGEVLSSYTVCNGKNVALSDASQLQCPNGGVKLDVPGSTKYVCNGVNGTDGLDGVDGLQGPQGAPGANGSNGTNGKSAYELALDNGFVGILS